MKSRFASPTFLSLAMSLSLIGCSKGSAPLSNDPPPAPLHADLDAAHEAYLDGDWVALGESVRDVLLDERASELVKSNALALLDKAYETNHGELPTRWKLTQGIESLTFGNIHGVGPDGPHDRVYLRGRMHDASHVTEVTVRRLPNETILDKTSKRGDYQIKREVPGFEDFNLDAYVPSLPPDGVFSVEVELDDGSACEGWFIGRSLASSSVPEMSSPAHAQTFTEGHPRVAFVPFHSPQYLPFERRSLSLWESGADDEGHPQTWGFWSDDPKDLSEIRIGDSTGGGGPNVTAELAPGHYTVMLDARESRSFGPVHLVRASRRVEPFHVVR